MPRILFHLLCLICILFPVDHSLKAQNASLQYQPPVVLSTGDIHPNYFALGDFDGDGKPDIAVTDSLQKTVSIYLNQGKGAFIATPIVTTLAVDNTAGALVAGDFNGDGKADLIVATIAGDQVSLVLLASGGGHFAVQPPLPGSFGFESAKLADFNGDGHTDVFLGGNGEPYLYLGRGDGTFIQQAVPNGSFPGSYGSVTAGVFSGSGHVDAVSADFSDPGYMQGSIDVFPGNGDGSLRTPTFYKSSAILNPGSLDVADFNHDGKLDLLIGGSGGVFIAPGNGEGTFQLAASQLIQLYATNDSIGLTNPDFSSAVATDLNLDGRADAVVLDHNTGLLSLILNDGTGTFPNALKTPFTFQLTALSYILNVADLNGDGLPDIVTSTPSAKTITILLSGKALVPSSATLASSGNSFLVGSNLVFTAKVTGGATAPTGTVTLSDGSASLGQQTLDASGTALFTTSTLSVGNHALTFNYSGDATYNPSTSSVLNQQVADFTPSLASGTQTVATGSSAFYSLAIAPLSGFAGSVMVTCSGLPSYATCSAPSVSVTGGSATATITVATTASALALANRTGNFLYACTLCGGFSLCFLRRSRAKWISLWGIFIVMAAFGALGCGGSAKPSQAPPAPTSQTSTFTINATATQNGVSVTHPVTATLITHS